LRFILVNVRQVLAEVEDDEMVARLRKIYRKHGWPDLGTHRRKECIGEVQRVMLEEYSDFWF
jgi:hypothetical protein